MGESVLSKTGADRDRGLSEGGGENPGHRPAGGRETGGTQGAQPLLRLRSIYDGTFTGAVVPGNGVAAELLLSHGVEIFGESRIGELLEPEK